MDDPHAQARRQAKQARLEAHLRWELVRAALLNQENELRSHARSLRAFSDLHHPRPRRDAAEPQPCSRCGSDLADGDGEEGDAFRLVFGYGSRFDLEEWFVALCDNCCAAFADWVAAEGFIGVQRIGWDEKWMSGSLAEDEAAAPPG